MAVENELSCCRPCRSETKTIHDVVKTRLKKEEEVLTLLSLHAGRFLVSVAELPFENAVSILNFLLLLELSAVLGFLLALACKSVLSRRIISLFKVLIRSVNRLTELTRNFGTWSNISCHSNSCFRLLHIKPYDVP